MFTMLAMKYTCKNAQLVFACWQAWTWLSWLAWTLLLTGLNMVELASLNTVELASLNMVVDRLEHACWNRLFMAWWTNRLERLERCWMIEHVVREWWNNKIEQWCYNNHELDCCIKSGFAWSNIRVQPLSIRQAVYNMLKLDWTILLF